MTSPVAPMPNETPEQRQARLDAAYRAHAELMARQRAAEQARMMPTPEPMPMRMPTPEPMPMGTPIAQQSPDPDFNINTAMNTFNQRLGELVRSGQMTVAQAQAAQGDMRALQLNPAAANRQAATDIAQRHLQVGKYHPENIAAAKQPQGGLTLGSPLSPQQQGVTKSPFIDEKGNTHFPDGSVMADGPGTVPPWAIPPNPARGLADQPMALPGGGGGFDESTGLYTPKPSLSTLLGQGLSKVGEMFRNAETKPNPRPGIFGGMQPEIAVKPQYDMPVMPTPMPTPMQQPQGLSLSNVPRTLTLSNVPQQPQGLSLSNVPQQQPTGMALGGLMRKYY